MVTQEEFEANNTITLMTWGRIEATFAIRSKLANQQPVGLMNNGHFGNWIN